MPDIPTRISDIAVSISSLFVVRYTVSVNRVLGGADIRAVCLEKILARVEHEKYIYVGHLYMIIHSNV